jgi:disulfide bond formation protein DsbB
LHARKNAGTSIEMTRPRTCTVALLATLAAVVALVVAFAAEQWGGLAPCALCLWERWPYRLAVVLGLIAMLLPRRPARIVLAALLLAVLAEAAIALVHVGVEQGLWPSPLPECTAPHLASGSIADRLASLPARPAKPCDEPSYLLPWVPVSLAAMNLAFALAFAAALATYLVRSQRGRRRRR